LVVEVGVDVWGVKMAVWDRKAARFEARAAWKGCVGSMRWNGVAEAWLWWARKVVVYMNLNRLTSMPIMGRSK
jgi:hypothetical protein